MARSPATARDLPPRIEIHLPPGALPAPRELQRALAELGTRCRAALGIEVPPLHLVLDPAIPPDRWELRLGSRHLRRVALTGPARADEILLATFRGIMDHAPSLLDLQALEDRLEALRSTHPVLVRRALEVLEPADLLAIARAFLRERLRLPPWPAILGVIAEDRRLRDPDDRPRHAELVRSELAAYWAPEVIDSLHRLGTPRWVRLTPDAEEALVERTTAGAGGLALQLSGVERAAWLDALRCAPPPPGDEPSTTPTTGLAPEATAPRVLLASPHARPAAAALLAGSVPHVPVLSTTELERSGTGPAQRVHWLEPPEITPRSSLA